MTHTSWWTLLIVLYAIVQVAYLINFASVGYLFSQPTDWITQSDVDDGGLDDAPPVLLLYPVLREAEDTMRTTMLSIAAAVDDYRPATARVVAIPNADDAVTIASLRRLTAEFDFLEVLEVPPTSDPAWASVWADWDSNQKVYWWHRGKRRAERALPAKKTRQLVYALYAFAAKLPGDDWLLSYLDADSAVPVSYFRIAAAGAKRFDVIQLTNVAGNLMDTWASTMHAMDHMAWDGSIYPHMSARGRHPFYVLGKGLFYRVSDLVAFGGFNPWLTIEDPEVGMRLWTNGRRLGVSDSPLIEEVPRTFHGGVTQRKRWIAGFFQSLHSPLKEMGMTWRQRMKARINLIPCLSLVLNLPGLPLGIWALVEATRGEDPVGLPLTVLGIVNIVAAVAVLTRISWAAWKRSGMVLSSRGRRLLYLLRVNPIFLVAYWGFWVIPIAIGFWMFTRDGGLVWQRTEKVDANHVLVRSDSEYGGGEAVDIRDSAIDLRGVSPRRQPVVER